MTKESPLRGMNIGSDVTVAMRELSGVNTFDLRVAPGSAAQSAVAEALGIDLPKKTGQALSMSEVQVLCLAPDWWLIIGMQDAENKLASLKSNDLYHFSIVNVTGQRTTIEIKGTHAHEVLAHLWEQDLRDKSFPVGSVSQGQMAKAPVIVCHIAPLRYHVMVRSSFALHLWAVLEDAAVEWM
jgi:sarcosine oxidase, subunit gamma